MLLASLAFSNENIVDCGGNGHQQCKNYQTSRHKQYYYHGSCDASTRIQEINSCIYILLLIVCLGPCVISCLVPSYFYRIQEMLYFGPILNGNMRLFWFFAKFHCGNVTCRSSGEPSADSGPRDSPELWRMECGCASQPGHNSVLRNLHIEH